MQKTKYNVCLLGIHIYIFFSKINNVIFTELEIK